MCKLVTASLIVISIELATCVEFKCYTNITLSFDIEIEIYLIERHRNRVMKHKCGTVK